MNEDEQTLNAFSAPNRRDAYTQARAATPEQKGLSYTDLLFDDIFGGAETPEQASQEENSLFSRPQIDGYYYDPAALPLGADPETDISWGGEGGFKTRRTKSGVVYEIQPMLYKEISLSERKANLAKNLGAAYEAVTEDPLGTATGLAKGIAEGVVGNIKAVSSLNATPRDVMNAAGMVMGASAPRLLDGYDPNVTRIFAGENAKNFPRGKRIEADRRILAGEDPQKVYEETTIQYLPQRGGLSRPVFSIDPKGASIRDFDALKQVVPSTSKNQVTKGGDGTVRLPIKDVVDFSEFYDNYPQIEGFEVAFDPTLVKDTASFDAGNKTLNLSLQNLEDDNPDKIRSIAIHELQHGVQAVERTSGGAAPSYFLEKTKEIDPVTGLEKPGPWRTNSAEMYKDVVKLNSLEKAAEKARKDFEDLGNFASPFKILKLYKDVGKTEYAFKSERYRLSKLAFQKYQENPGEIESRAAQLWAELTPEERQKTLPSTVYDRAANEGYSVYARLGQEPIYGENYMPTGRLPVAIEKELRKKLEDDLLENPDSKKAKREFAEGGMVEEEQMNRLMQQGGMADDGMSREPVTGNNIPPGALASEVRDDVDAKLSGGEYVVPADVLRYYGVRFFEDLRSQAKQGMREMESAGRIGGVPVDPRGVPMQGQDEELTPEEEQMLAQAMSGMAEGGMAFDRGDFTMDSNATTTRLYFNPTTGKKQSINFLGDRPLGGIPDGFVPWTQALQDTYDATNPATPKPKKKKRDDDGFGNPEDTTNSYDAWADENYDAITNDPFKFGMDLLKNPNDDGGLFGVLTGKDKDILNIAGANAALKRLEAQGKLNSPEYVALSEEVKRYVGGLSLVEKGLISTGVVGMGNQYDAALRRKEGENPPAATPPATAPAAPAAAPAAAPLTPEEAARAANRDPRPRTFGSQDQDDRVFGGAGDDRVIGGNANDRVGTSYNSPSTNRDRQSAADPRPATPAPTPTSTSSQGGSNTYSSSTYGSGNASYTQTPRPGSERFAEGGLVPKPKKPRAKTKGLAGKQ